MKGQLERMLSSGILPAVTIEKIMDAVPVAQAMMQGGLNVMEVAFRTPAAAACIRKIKAEVSGMKVGAAKRKRVLNSFLL